MVDKYNIILKSILYLMLAILEDIKTKKNKKTIKKLKNTNPFKIQYQKLEKNKSKEYIIDNFKIVPFSIKKNNLFNFDILYDDNLKKGNGILLENEININGFKIIIDINDDLDTLVNKYNKVYNHWHTLDKLYEHLHSFFELIFVRDMKNINNTTLTNFIKRKESLFLPLIGKLIIEKLLDIKKDIVTIIKYNVIENKYNNLDKIYNLSFYDKTNDFKITGQYGTKFISYSMDNFNVIKPQIDNKNINFENLDDYVLMYRIKNNDPEVNITEKDINVLKKDGVNENIINNLINQKKKINTIKKKLGLLSDTPNERIINNFDIGKYGKLDNFINQMGGIDSMVIKLDKLLNKSKSKINNEEIKKIEKNIYDINQKINRLKK